MRWKPQLMRGVNKLTGQSGNRFLLDTNAIIALQRQDMVIMALLLSASEIFLPVTAIGEFGAYKSQRVEENRKNVANFIVNRTILNINADSAEIYGQIKQHLRKKGRPIPENDIWIASLAIQYNLTLITRDAHFSEIQYLTTQSW